MSHIPLGPLAERLRSARGASFIGRSEERAQFAAALDGVPGTFGVLYLHGPGGVGKSALLSRFADEAQARGRRVITVDGRDLTAREEDFEAEAGPVGADERVVLLVDTFERCQGLERWLRESYLPALPGDAVVVIAGRRPPALAWRTDPGWDGLLRVVRLHDLPPHDAGTLLTSRGVPPGEQAPLIAFAGGHPLALRLAADVSLHGERMHTRSAASTDVIKTLLGQLVGTLPSAAHRRALEVCAHALATTEELLRAALTDAPASELFAWLRELPFVETGRHGLFPHDVVREVLDTDLRWRDPGTYEAMHRRLHAHLLTRAKAAEGTGVLPAMSALTYLHRTNGFLSQYVTWQADGDVHEDTFVPEEAEEVLSLVRDAEGPGAEALTAFWIGRRPQALRICRRTDSRQIVAVWACLTMDRPDPEELAADPVVSAAWEHCGGATPLRDGEHLAIVRFLMEPKECERPSPVMDLFLHRAVYEFVLADRLAWSYIAMADNSFWHPLMAYMDQHLLTEPVRVEGRVQSLYAHDWRVIPPRIWLDFSVTLELGGLEAGRTAHRTGGCVVLTREEFDEAVRAALTAWHRPDELVTNPLVRSRLVVEHPEADAVAALREAVTESIETLHGTARDEQLHKVVTTTYFKRVPNQEAVAERLHISFSTYRRHLAAALERISGQLWQMEIHGTPPAAQPPSDSWPEGT
ncbi:ATP-binding protein [Streptomyces sp. NPDC060205]|uniref:ATP-binding protein n=1 Tax=Streptomyces sp. NPDC060205 TaxID=3347072 RepID=UPI0036524B9A